MKFCDERIQKHLLNGRKIKRESCDFLMFFNNKGFLCYQSECQVNTCCINKKDLIADDWEIVEPEYDWDKIIKDKILCEFSDDKDFRYNIFSTLKMKDNNFYYTDNGTTYRYCKPFNPENHKIAKNIKDYEK